MASFTDTFNRADSTTTLGPPWVARTGVWGISGNRAYVPLGTAFSAVTVDSVPDVTVQVDVPVKGASGDVGLLFRYVDSANFWRWIFNPPTSERRLQKVVAGAVTTLQNSSVTFSSTDSLKVVLSGSTLRFYANGIEVSSISPMTDSTHSTATLHGMRSNSHAGHRLDNFFCSEVVSPDFYVGTISF